MTDDVLAEESWPVDNRAAVFAVRQRARELGLTWGLGTKDAEAAAIAISELASNIVDYAGNGCVVMKILRDRGRLALAVVASDDGPGISDIQWALTDGCSSGSGLGSGLPAVRRLMDEFSIESTVGRGTAVAVKKWLENQGDRARWRPDGSTRS